MIFFAINKLSDEAAAFLKFAFIFYFIFFQLLLLEKGFECFFRG